MLLSDGDYQQFMFTHQQHLENSFFELSKKPQYRLLVRYIQFLEQELSQCQLYSFFEHEYKNQQVNNNFDKLDIEL